MVLICSNSFVIQFHEALNCNVHPTNFMSLCKPTVCLPWLWKDVFAKWFRQFFVTKQCTTDKEKRKLLALPVMFSLIHGLLLKIYGYHQISTTF